MNSKTTFELDPLGLPDIAPHVYAGKKSLDVVRSFQEDLKKVFKNDPKNTNALLVKNAFRSYENCVACLGNAHKALFFDLHKTVVHKHSDISIHTLARIKSVLRFFQKCRRTLYRNKTLYDISDIFAGRIVIDSHKFTELELIKLCYEIAVEVLDFMLLHDYLPVPTTGVKEASQPFDHQKFPDIVVPEEDMLPDRLIGICKDYIKHPKTLTAYQSLHLVFVNSKGERMEIQIRTFDMDDRAENCDSTKHDAYEELQDCGVPPIRIDYTKISMPFFSIKHGKLYDKAGIVLSEPCMEETYRGTSQA